MREIKASGPGWPSATVLPWKRSLGLAICQMFLGASIGFAQTSLISSAGGGAQSPPLQQGERSSLARYVDPVNGMSADEAVSYALSHNGEVLAARKEIQAAQALAKQAGLRANPRLELTGSQNVAGPDNGLMVTGMLPLELGGRRAGRVAVAERELELRRQTLADRERLVAAEVRLKFGATLAEVQRLEFIEELLNLNQKNYTLVSARVTEGRTPLLEENMALVEVNRVKSEQEMRLGKIEVLLFELKNLIGLPPDGPLKLRGDLRDLVKPPASPSEAIQFALSERPDLKAAQAAERLAEAHLTQARTEGRFDASLVLQYQYMNFGYPLKGFNDAGRLEPITGRFHYFGGGISLEIPVRNKNQGAIEAAVAEREAARQRREFIELTIRREVAAAYSRFERAARAEEIFRHGVRGQAGRNLAVLRRAYELGAKTLLDYIAEERRFIEVETGFIDALLEAYQAAVEIERSTSSAGLIKR